MGRADIQPVAPRKRQRREQIVGFIPGQQRGTLLRPSVAGNQVLTIDRKERKKNQRY
jgi:hypothetical protein